MSANRCVPRSIQNKKQVVDYHGKESAGTIIVDTPNEFLFLVQGDGKELRYGIGVGRPGFTWSGVKRISAKKEWPAWTPPPEMLARRPDLPRQWKAGRKIRSAPARCIWDRRSTASTAPTSPGPSAPRLVRLLPDANEDVIDLYGRVNVGTRVIVI